MNIFFRIASYGPENVAEEIITQRRNFNLLCDQVEDLYEKYFPLEAFATELQLTKDIHFLISFPFDVKESGSGTKEGKDFTEFWSRRFFDISAFQKLSLKEKQLTIFNNTKEALLFLSKNKEWKIEYLLQELFHKINLEIENSL